MYAVGLEVFKIERFFKLLHFFLHYGRSVSIAGLYHMWEQGKLVDKFKYSWNFIRITVTYL